MSFVVVEITASSHSGYGPKIILKSFLRVKGVASFGNERNAFESLLMSFVVVEVTASSHCGYGPRIILKLF